VAFFFTSLPRLGALLSFSSMFPSICSVVLSGKATRPYQGKLVLPRLSTFYDPVGRVPHLTDNFLNGSDASPPRLPSLSPRPSVAGSPLLNDKDLFGGIFVGSRLYFFFIAEFPPPPRLGFSRSFLRSVL